MKKEKLFLALLTAALATPATLAVTNSITPVLAEEDSKTSSSTSKINLNTVSPADIILLPAQIMYTGSSVTNVPSVSIEKDGKKLTTTDYTAKWTDGKAPVNAGSYGVTITAATNSSNWTGETTDAAFAIILRDLRTVDFELTGISSFDSKNPDKAPIISKIIDKISNETLNLIQNTDYTVSYTLILENGDEKKPEELNGAVPKKGKITLTAQGQNCSSSVSKEFSFSANSSSTTSSSTTSSSNNSSTSSSTTGSANSKPTLTLPTNAIKVENEGTLKKEDVQKLEKYINKNQNDYGYNLKVNSASVATNNGQSTFTMSVRATLNDDSKINITLSNLKKRRSEGAMVEENEFVEFVDLEEEMEDASLDYVTVSDPGQDGKKVTIKGIKASDAFRVNYALNGTKVRKILADAGYKVSDLDFSSVAKMNHEFAITDLSQPISIMASATAQSSPAPSTPVGGSGIQLPSTSTQPVTPTVIKKPAYRFYNTLTGEHFYTTSEAERDELIKDSRWNNEGQGWISPATSRIVVYRLCNPTTGEHHYTTDKNEYDTLPSYGWAQEGVGFYSADPQLSDIAVVYRLFNPKANDAGSHHYTMNEQERNNLVNNGWRDEGIAWYSIK